MNGVHFEWKQSLVRLKPTNLGLQVGAHRHQCSPITRLLQVAKTCCVSMLQYWHTN